MFDEVQRRLESPIRAAHAHTLFANQIYCGECGDKYIPRRWHSTTYNDVIWKCNSKCCGKSKCTTPHIYQDLLIAAFRDVVRILLRENPDVWRDCLGVLSDVMDISGIVDIDAGDGIPVEHPNSAERSIWRIIFPKAVVRSDGSLVFHIIDGSQIPYYLQPTAMRYRKPLTPTERAAVVEEYRNGVPASILTERYACSPYTIRTIIWRAKKSTFE